MKNFIKMIFASCLGVLLAGGLLMVIFFLMLGSVISKSFDSIGGKEQKFTVIKAHSILEVNPDGSIDDKKGETYFPFEAFSSESSDYESYTLGEIKKALKQAAEDENIDAVSLDLSKAQMGLAAAEELREALLQFKSSGKPIYVYSDMMSKGNYFVSCVADKIYLNPEGSIMLNGFASQTLFYTGPMEKLGVKMEIFKVGTYKGAVEPYMLKQLSEPNRQQIQSYLDGLWGQMASGICAARKINMDSLNFFVNNDLGFSGADNALRYGLVDSLMYQLDYKPLLAQKVDPNAGKDDYHGVSIKSYLNGINADAKISGDAIGYVVAEGEIMESQKESPYTLNIPNVIDMEVAKKLRTLADDDNVKAVVMRVNSPGGSAFISEQIWKEVNDLKAKKPVVVSMGNYAASGGYYISCAASKIFADSATLTGSIGIFGMFPNFAGTAKKIDLTYDVVKTHALADLGNTLRPMSVEEKALIQNMVNKGYELFKKRVAEGRGMTTAAVDSIGQGRVWLGSQAVNLGLVDKIGSVEEAFKEAARLANIDDYYIFVPKGKPKNLFEKIMSSMGNVKSRFISTNLNEEERMLLNTLHKSQMHRGIMAMPYEDITALE